MITSPQWRENRIFEKIISCSGTWPCHHVVMVVWGTVRDVPSIIRLPSPVKAAFSPLMTVLFLNLNLCKAPQKKWLWTGHYKRRKAGILWCHHSVVKFRWKFQSPSNTNEPFWWAMKGQKFYKHMEGKRVMFRTVEAHVDRARAVCWNENSLGSGEQSGRN